MGESSATTTVGDYLHISAVALTISLFSFSYQKWTACPSSWAVNISSSSSSSSESSELLITAALRVWSSSRTDRNLSDRKQSAAQINHAAVKALTLKLGPNRLITMRRLLNFGFLVVTHACRSSFRICSWRSCVLAHLSCCTNTGLEQIQLIWEQEGHHPKLLFAFWKSTIWSFLSVSISFRSPWISLCVCFSSSGFQAACLSNCRRILTARHGTDWSHRGTLWFFTVLTYYCTSQPTCDFSILCWATKVWESMLLIPLPALVCSFLAVLTRNSICLSFSAQRFSMSETLSSSAEVEPKNKKKKKKITHTTLKWREISVRQDWYHRREREDYIARISTFSQTATSPQPGSCLDQFKSYQ